MKLLLEDKKSLLNPMAKFFEGEGYEVVATRDVRGATRAISSGLDFAVLDLKVPFNIEEGDEPNSENTINLLKSIKGSKLIKNSIVYTASESELNLSNRDKIRALGVKYIFYKDQDDQDENAILRRLRKFEKRRVNKKVKREYFFIGKRVDNIDKKRMVYFDEKMQEVMENIEENIASDFMLYGPSGSGKGAIAKEIHRKYSEYIGKPVAKYHSTM